MSLGITDIVDSTAILKIDQLFSTQKGVIEKEFSAYFYRYFSHFFKDPKRFHGYLEQWKYFFDMTKAREGSVLDLGCGFGLIAILFGLLGAQEVIGYDLNTEKINLFRKLLDYLGPEIKNVSAVLGDSTTVEFPDRRFDAVIMNESISHVREMKSSLEEAYRVLKVGGYLIIRDGNNGLFFPGKIRRRRFWKRIERGPVDPSTFRATDIPLAFIEVRKRMIIDRFPHLDPERIRFLAEKTAGMFGREIFEAVEEFEKAGELSNYPEWHYRNPVTGEFPEREINPFCLKRALREMGFDVSLIPYFYSTSFRNREMLIKHIYYLFGRYFPITHLFISPGFTLLGIKTDRQN